MPRTQAVLAEDTSRKLRWDNAAARKGALLDLAGSNVAMLSTLGSRVPRLGTRIRSKGSNNMTLCPPEAESHVCVLQLKCSLMSRGVGLQWTNVET